MVVGRITSRLSRTVAAQCRSSLLLSGRQNQHHVPIISNQFHSLVNPQNKVVADQLFLCSNYVLNSSTLQKIGISSSACPEPNDGTSSAEQNDKTSEDPAAEGSNKQVSDEDEEDLSKDDLVKLLSEKEELLKTKQTELQQMQDRVLRTWAEMENVRERAKREVDNSNKFAIESFAKNLLDVADDLGRASSVVGRHHPFSKLSTYGQLKTLLEGVEETYKKLAAVLKKFGVEKFDPTNEQFDPNRHNAQFQVPDPSKPSGTVAIVLKPGYSLHERIIWPAEVGVVEDLSKDDLVKLLSEKEKLLKTKQTELQQMQDRVLRTYAEMENVRERAKREVDNSNKFAIQSFAMNLLDVADNLSRVSSVVKESFAKIDTSADTAGAVPLLKTLLEGVEMIDKQLDAVFKKFGVEKFYPTNEQFDPNRHNAQFQVPSPSKPSGTVAIVFKPGYSLHERIIRPAEVGVAKKCLQDFP